MCPLLFVLLIINSFISISYSADPGDPFPVDFSNHTDPLFLSEPKNVSVQTTIKITEEPLSTDNVKQIDVNNTLLFTSTLKPIDESFSIDTKYLVDIVQWKYTDLRTHKVRYWYHVLGTPMGSGWVFDRIICRAYIRHKPFTVPIRAYHSETQGIWTNTLQIESNPLPIGNNQWKYDGMPFYAYKTSMNSSLLKPVWRYWNRINYGTEDVSEPRRSYLRLDDIADDDLPEWKLDRIIFYAFAPQINVTDLNN